MAHTTETYYYYVPNLQALDPTAREVDPSAYAWVQPTIIEDEDLTFGGKALSTWYEEDRRRHSSGSDEEERRGHTHITKPVPPLFALPTDIFFGIAFSITTGKRI
ncbi:hypothetical protein DER44DRAFT_899751 [Fusarium oxysporum]|nr:hypothetical protein DER44DRAFT_899751 [Fusarium oxysporum]